MGAAAGVIAAIVAALVALPAGIVIDAVAARLAVPPRDDDAPAETDATEPEDPGDPSGPVLGRAAVYFLGRGGAWRTTSVVTAAAALAFVLGLQYGGGWELIVVCMYVAVLLACTVTDLLARRLPNALLYPAIVLAFGVGMAAPDAGRLDVLGGGALSGGVFLAMALLPQGGLGDAKLGLFTGLALGFELAVPAIFVTALAGGAVSVTILVLTRLRAWHQPVPYGQYIALGAAVVMVFGGTAFARI